MAPAIGDSAKKIVVNKGSLMEHYSVCIGTEHMLHCLRLRATTNLLWLPGLEC